MRQLTVPKRADARRRGDSARSDIGSLVLVINARGTPR